MNQKSIAISLGTLFVAALIASGTNAADNPNKIVAPDMKPRPVTALKKKIESPSFKRGLVRNSLSLYSRKGQRLEARYTKRGYRLYDVSRGKPARAEDGTYRLQGGGRIKVEDGYVTWANKLARDRSSIAGIVAPIP